MEEESLWQLSERKHNLECKRIAKTRIGIPQNNKLIQENEEINAENQKTEDKWDPVREEQGQDKDREAWQDSHDLLRPERAPILDFLIMRYEEY